jgi:catechol 2,3-dioxygenase-like lactoylglutathione lyase family enzyme
MAAKSPKSSRDIIIRTANWSEAKRYYGKVLGLPVVYRSKTMVGFETGSFCLYVEKGDDHGPVFELLVPDIQTAKQRLLAAGCVVIEEDPSLPRCYLKDPFGMVYNIGQGSKAK